MLLSPFRPHLAPTRAPSGDAGPGRQVAPEVLLTSSASVHPQVRTPSVLQGRDRDVRRPHQRWSWGAFQASLLTLTGATKGTNCRNTCVLPIEKICISKASPPQVNKATFQVARAGTEGHSLLLTWFTFSASITSRPKIPVSDLVVQPILQCPAPFPACLFRGLTPGFDPE